MSKYYKVVRRTPAGDLLSATVCQEPWMVVYRPHTWAVPNVPESRLFVFSDLREAMRYATKTSRWMDSMMIVPEVWRCHVRGVAGRISRVPRVSKRDAWKEHWKRLRVCRLSTSGVATSSGMYLPKWMTFDAPRATIIVKKVMLVERVWSPMPQTISD